MRKFILLTLLIIIVSVSCRPPANRSVGSETASSETGVSADTIQENTSPLDSPEWVRNHDKSSELLDRMGEVYNNNGPGHAGFSFEDEKTPDFIEGVYLNDEGILVIQISGDSIAERRELEKVLGADGFLLEHITKYNQIYSQKQLYEIMEQLGKRVHELEGTKLIANLSGCGVGLRSIDIRLILNSPEKRREFRKAVMDSPAFRFIGPEEPVPTPVVGVNDTLGVYLRPEYDAYSTDTEKVKFILYNRNDEYIQCGEHYFITFEDEKGVWRELPINGSAIDIAYIVWPDQEFSFIANLYPDVHPNIPGRYRFFYNVRIPGSGSTLMMADFRLTDKRKEWENAAKTPVIPQGNLVKTTSDIEKESAMTIEPFEVVEVMPEFPENGQKGYMDFVAERIPENFPKEGRVIVQFIVEVDGSITNFDVVRSYGKEQDEMAIDILKQMPKWIPGKMRGKPIRVKYTVPVTFTNLLIN